MNKTTIKHLQQEYAKHCGYKDFEELREKNEVALRIWYLKMLEPEKEKNENNNKNRSTTL